MILHGVIRLWWQAKTAREIFLTMCLIGHSINKSECKVELKFDNFLGRNCCCDAICLIIFHYFTLCWKCRFYRVNETTLTQHLLLVLLNKPNLLNSACIDHDICILFFANYWKVWRHRYALFHESRVFFLLYATKTSALQRFNLLHVVFFSGGVKSCFHKKWWWRTRRTWYRVKFWWWKVRIGNAICI